MLGFGELGTGRDHTLLRSSLGLSVGSCTYHATVNVKPSPDGIYRVTSGNTQRGYLSTTTSPTWSVAS
jgi:hypothetical protein